MDFDIIDFKNYEKKTKNIELKLDYNKISVKLDKKLKKFESNFKETKINRRKFKIDREIEDDYENIDFVNLNKKLNISNNSMKIINGYNFLKEKNILIYTPDFLNDLKRSYSNYGVDKQFLMDLHRCHLFINYTRAINPEEVKNYLEWKYDEEMKDRILLSCTQAIMGMPFQILQKLFSSLNLYVSECSNPHNNQKNNLQIFLNAYEDKINIFVKKRLRVFYIDKELDDINKYIVDTIIDFNLYKDQNIQKKDNYVLIKFSIKNF